MSRIRDWFTASDPDGPAKIAAWIRGDDGKFHGFTYSSAGIVSALILIAAIIYPPTEGWGSLIALVLAIFVLGGRQLLERQARKYFWELRQSKEQFQKTHQQDYLRFIRLRGEGLLLDNKVLRPEARTEIEALLAWAAKREKPERPGKKG